MTVDAAARSRMVMQRTIRLGLIGAAVVIYLAVIGMIESFNERPIITGVIQFGTVLIVAVMALFGYLAARSRAGEMDTERPWLNAAIAGGLTGAGTGIFVIVVELLIAAGYDPRVMFVNITPALTEILTFGTNPYVGTLILTVGGALIGMGAGFLVNVSQRVRSMIVVGLTSIVLTALAAPLLEVMMDGLGIPTAWLFQREGLTPIGVVFVVVVVLGVYLGLERFGGIRGAAVRLPGASEKNVNTVLVLVTGVVLLALPWIVNSFISDVLGTVGLYILLGLGLNIVVGFAGLLDLGYVAFYAVGAYSVAILTARSSFMVGGSILAPATEGFTNFWVALPITILLAVVIGALIGAPVLRLRGDYLAIVTLGFGEIIRTLALSDWLKPYLGGPQGITEVAAIPLFGLDTRNPQVLYYVIFAFVLIAFAISVRLKDSRVGRAWAAMREDEDIAEGMGVSVIKYKLLAFAMGAAVGCLGGAFFAAKLGVVNPGSFTLLVSINVLAVVVLGGMGSIPGVVLGSLVLVGLPELLREFGEYRLHLYGAILIAIMILKPEGLLPDWRRARELHSEVRPEDLIEEPGTPQPVV